MAFGERSLGPIPTFSRHQGQRRGPQQLAASETMDSGGISVRDRGLPSGPKSTSAHLRRGVPGQAFFIGQPSRFQSRCEECLTWQPTAPPSATESRPTP